MYAKIFLSLTVSFFTWFIYPAYKFNYTLLIRLPSRQAPSLLPPFSNLSLHLHSRCLVKICTSNSDMVVETRCLLPSASSLVFRFRFGYGIREKLSGREALYICHRLYVHYPRFFDHITNHTAGQMIGRSQS